LRQNSEMFFTFFQGNPRRLYGVKIYPDLSFIVAGVGRLHRTESERDHEFSKRAGGLRRDVYLVCKETRAIRTSIMNVN